MKRRLPLLGLLVLLSACAGVAKAPPEDPAKQAETARVLKAGMELGRVRAGQDPGFVLRLEEASFAWLLLRGPAPLAGARRLLDLKERAPQDPLLPLFFAAGAQPDPLALSEQEDFRSGAFFNEYDLALFRPFFRQALLAAVKDPQRSTDQLDQDLRSLQVALKLTPRFAGNYPNQVGPELRAAIDEHLARWPEGPASDRMRMFLLWDERNGAWSRKREALDRSLQALADASKDALLKLEIKDALAAPLIKPEQSFWWSLILPGSAQVSHGDLQGGLLLGGLTLSAWIWMGAKLALAHGTDDAATRQVAYGDAAWASSLALLGHGFTALNAAEQARGMNVVIQWDLLAKDRLQAQPATGSEP